MNNINTKEDPYILKADEIEGKQRLDKYKTIFIVENKQKFIKSENHKLFNKLIDIKIDQLFSLKDSAKLYTVYEIYYSTPSWEHSSERFDFLHKLLNLVTENEELELLTKLVRSFDTFNLLGHSVYPLNLFLSWFELSYLKDDIVFSIIIMHEFENYLKLGGFQWTPVEVEDKEIITSIFKVLREKEPIEFYNLKGLYFFVQEIYDEALSYFLKSYKQSKKDVQCFCTIIDTYIKLAQLDKACVFFNDNIDNFYDSINEHYFEVDSIRNLIVSLGEAGKYKEVLEINKQLIYFVQWYLDNYEVIIEFIEIAMESKIEQTKIEERNKIMANLSHTVKNMLSSVLNPLEKIKETGAAKPVVVDNAIRGANLIRNLVNSMNLSFKGSIEDFVYDIQNNTYENSSSVEEMFIESLKQSISTTFDGKYFKKFVDNFYSTKAKFLEAKQHWSDISQFNDLDKINSFMNKYLVKTTLNISKAREFVIGDDKGSALKLFILIQEIILNAVKYSSFVSKGSRSLQVYFDADDKNISIVVSNSFKPDIQVKSSGLGQEIINNFSKLLNTKPIIRTGKGKYLVEIVFMNLWQKA
jgi:tetratricopeptide (TPR) repeat protein